jgi:beta-mannosidase
VACRGACWAPLDAVTLAAPAEAYDDAIARLAAEGTNLVRVPGTTIYETDALYDALDARGVLLWQDLMFAHLDYPEDDAFLTAVTAEVDVECSRLQARPALAVVCGRCDAAGEPPPLFREVLAARAAAILPGACYVASRPITF